MIMASYRIGWSGSNAARSAVRFVTNLSIINVCHRLPTYGRAVSLREFFGRIIYVLELVQIICLSGFFCCVNTKTTHALKQLPFN
jgi:hypothetical protein